MRLVYEVLPVRVADQTVEDCALCQLALVGSNHLVELALDRALASFVESGAGGITLKSLRAANQHDMLTHWLPTVTGKQLDEQMPPVASMQALRSRRNATVHRESALATVPMSRAAIFSAVEGCRFIFSHAGESFPWEDSIRAYPLPKEAWFAEVPPPDANSVD